MHVKNIVLLEVQFQCVKNIIETSLMRNKILRKLNISKNIQNVRTSIQFIRGFISSTQSIQKQ